jgi:hypothetical protein
MLAKITQARVVGPENREVGGIAEGMFAIDEGLKELVESGVAVVVGTTDGEGRPELVYAWGPRVLADKRSILLCVERARASGTLANLADTGKIAMTVADPATYRSIQFKGTLLKTGDASAEDCAWVTRHRAAFASSTALVGDDLTAMRNTWMENEPLYCIEFAVDAAFDQTPGPEAGRPL